MGRQTWAKYKTVENDGRRAAPSRRPSPALDVEFPEKLQCLFRPARFKVLYGGRGGSKSWGVARWFILKARSERQKLFLCARELQNSIADSVYSLLQGQAAKMGVAEEFIFQKKEIWHKQSGSKFIFKGIRHNIEEVKSTEGVNYCWVEEAAKLTQNSLDVLFPTIREPNSEIILTYNPELESDPVHQMFVIDAPPPDSVVVKVGWQDNPWFPDVLDTQRKFLQRKDPDRYYWIWDGNCRKASEYAIYAKMVAQEPFDSPAPGEIVNGQRVRFYYGGDWGFGSDPCAGVRAFVVDRVLYIDQEAYAFDLDVEKIAEFFKLGLPGVEAYTSYYDSSRPELIKRLVKAGLDARACTKYAGSIEAGIAFIQSFDRIVVHPRCVNTYEEAMSYKYKVKKRTLESEQVEYVEPEDKFNHCMDSLRYAFDHEINNIGQVAVSQEQLDALAAMGPTRRRR